MESCGSSDASDQFWLGDGESRFARRVIASHRAFPLSLWLSTSARRQDGNQNNSIWVEDVVRLLNFVGFQPIQFLLLQRLLIYQLCLFPGNVKRIHFVGVSGNLSVIEAVQNLQGRFLQLLR